MPDLTTGGDNKARIGVLHVTDTLAAGGAERAAVHIVNHMPRDRYRMFFCTTRHDGPLADLLTPDVRRLRLERRSTLELSPVLRLNRFIRRHNIRIVHAHETSLFVACLACRLPPFPALVWHDNFGGCEMIERPLWAYRLLTRRVHAVLAVNQVLVNWSRNRLCIPSEKVWYVPNFVPDMAPQQPVQQLAGRSGARIVCVANLRPQKDHITLVRAMAQLVKHAPHAHLFLVGQRGKQADCLAQIQQEIRLHGLSENISYLGQRGDVSDILRACDIGVLSSASEGLPLALLEYGMAGLAAVATRVGQCAEVLDSGRAGLLVPPHAPSQLAEAMLSLVHSFQQREVLRQRFRNRVRQLYCPDRVIERICHVYETFLKPISKNRSGHA